MARSHWHRRRRSASGAEAEPDARAYDLFGQHWGRTISLAVRTSNSPLQVAAVVPQLLGERDPRLAVFAISTTADLVQRAVATRCGVRPDWTFVLRRSIDAQLFGITTMNLPALTASASALLVAAALACLVPAWRATRIDPVEALRIE